MADSRNKYGSNRNLWRKVVGYGSPPRPQVTDIVDPSTQVTYSLDLQSTFRHRDYFEVKPGYVFYEPFVPISYSYGEYDEGLIYFTTVDSDSGSANFNFVFSGNPYVVLTMEEGYNNMENVNYYGFTYDSASLTIKTSAPFSGTIRYRAIWAPSYPTIVTSSEPASASLWITASAGAVNAGGTIYNASFAVLPVYPVYFYDTPWDTAGNGMSDVYFESAVTTNTYAFAGISAPYYNQLHFIAQIV